jgi:hypothetical protein
MEWRGSELLLLLPLLLDYRIVVAIPIVRHEATRVGDERMDGARTGERVRVKWVWLVWLIL